MAVKLILVLLAGLAGGWMLFDGVHVLRHGKYFGPDLPGPWRHLPEALGIDPLRMGPVFVVLGALWLLAAAVFLVTGSRLPLAGCAILGLWYLPVGTALSLATLALIWLGG